MSRTHESEVVCHCNCKLKPDCLEMLLLRMQIKASGVMPTHLA